MDTYVSHVRGSLVHCILMVVKFDPMGGPQTRWIFVRTHISGKEAELGDIRNRIPYEHFGKLRPQRCWR